MKKIDLFQIGAYLAVSLVSVGLAFVVSISMIGRAPAQEGEAPVEIPITDDQAPGEEPTSEMLEMPRRSEPEPEPTRPSNPAMAELEGFLEPFIYDIVNRRDPFLAYAEFIPQDDGLPARPLSAAQRYAIEELKLVGIMWDVREPKAMFVDPDKEILTLGRDESIGNRNGYIAAIREGEVVVVEAIRRRGEVSYRTRVLRIER
jgi:type IV pilus assembly protein PilP